MRLRILRWGDCPGLSGQTRCTHKDPREGMKEAEEVEFESDRNQKMLSCWLERWNKRQPLRQGMGPSSEPLEGTPPNRYPDVSLVNPTLDF